MGHLARTQTLPYFLKAGSHLQNKHKQIEACVHDKRAAVYHQILELTIQETCDNQ